MLHTDTVSESAYVSIGQSESTGDGTNEKSVYVYEVLAMKKVCEALVENVADAFFHLQYIDRFAADRPASRTSDALAKGQAAGLARHQTQRWIQQRTERSLRACRAAEGCQKQGASSTLRVQPQAFGGLVSSASKLIPRVERIPPSDWSHCSSGATVATNMAAPRRHIDCALLGDWKPDLVPDTG